MKKIITLLFLIFGTMLFANNPFQKDSIDLNGKQLDITFIGHGTLMMEFDNKVIHIDPVSRYGDYSPLPKADIILITHAHGDHLDPDLVKKLSKTETIIVGNKEIKQKIKKAKPMKNGDTAKVKDIEIKAVPAYNTTEGRDKFHSKGRDNGFILNLNGKKVYIAGDTEDIPEMENYKDIEIAFLPMNQPYTMTPKQVAEVVKEMKPAIFYPYHYGDSKIEELKSLLKDVKDVDLRIRDLK